MKRNGKILLTVLMILFCITIFASCTAQDITNTKVTITFKDGDTVLNTETLDVNSTFLEPTKEGFNFEGWYLDPEFKNKVTSVQTTTTVLYAKWSIKTFVVTFKDTDGSIIPVNGKETQVVTYGMDAIAPKDPISDGKDFLGWDKPFTNVKSNLTVYATYKDVKKLTIYNYDNTEVSRNLYKIGDDIETVINSAKTDIPTGFSKGNWYSDKERTKIVETTGLKQPNSDLSLYLGIELKDLNKVTLNEKTEKTAATYDENEIFEFNAQFEALSENLITYEYGWYVNNIKQDNNTNKLTLKGLPVGTYKIEYRVKATYNDQVKKQSESLEIVIANAEIKDIKVNNVVLNYDNNAHSLLVNSKKGDKVSYKLSKDENYVDSLNFVNCGEYIIDIKVERENYNTLYLQNTLVINKADLSIKVKEQTITYGESLSDYSFEVTGLKGKDTISVLNGTPKYSATSSGNEAGSFDVTIKGLIADNYNVIFEKGTMTINKADLTLWIDDLSIKYGDSLPEIKIHSNGLVNGDTLDTLGNITIDSNYNVGDNVGNYSLSLDAQENTNYVLNLKGATLSVLKKNLKLTVLDKTAIYGNEAPAFEYVFEGFVGDDESVLNIVPTLTSNYTLGDDCGVYDIVAKDILLSNYNVLVTNGKLTISQKGLSLVKANSYTFTYGDDVPTITGEVIGLTNGDTIKTLGITFTSNMGNVHAGEFITTATIPELKNYYLINEKVDGTLSVSKKELNIIVDNLALTYGDPIPEYTYKVSEFGYKDTIDNVKDNIVLSSNYTPGGYSMSCDISVNTTENTNYTFKVLNETTPKLTVNKKELVIIVKDQTITYGEENSYPEYEISGFVLGQTIADIHTPYGSTNYFVGNDAGTYDLTLDGFYSNFYSFNVTPAKLHVDPKPLSITVKDENVTYGNKAPVFSVLYSNDFVGKDNENSLLGTLTYETDYTSSSVVGTYVVKVSGLTSNNYNITYVDGQITVNAKAIEISYNETVLKNGNVWTRELSTLHINELINGDQISGSISTSDFKVKKYIANGISGNDFVVSNLDIKNAGISVLDSYTISYKLTIDIVDDVYNFDAKGVTTTYDGLSHKGTVNVLTGNTTLTYSSDKVTFVDTMPEFTNAGTYEVFYKIQDNAGIKNDFNGSIIIQINKANLEIIAENKTIEYYEDKPELTLSFVDFKNGEDQSVLSGLQVTCDYTLGNNAGTYPIIVSVDTDENYEITVRNGSLLVNKVELTVTALDSEIKYGDSLPVIDLTYVGFKNNETKDNLSGSLKFNTNYVTGSDVNTYDVTPYGLQSDNYTFKYVKGNLVVKAKPLEIEAKDLSLNYGDTASLEVKYYGLINNEDTKSISGLSVTSNYTVKSTPGTYDIIVSATSTNYALTLTSGTVTVSKAPISVKVNACEITYGDNKPAFTSEITGYKNNETINDLGGAIKYTCSYENGGNQGTYKIDASGFTSLNYEFKYVPSLLTVNKAKLNIKANDKLIKYGDEIGGLTVTFVGLKNSDKPSDFIVSFNHEYVVGSPVGTYQIQPVVSENTNYTYTIEHGVLTVEQQIVNVKWVGADKTYTYNGADQSSEIKASYMDLGKETPLTYNITGKANVFKNAGDYTFTVDTTNANKNYIYQNTSKNIKIEKATYNNIGHDVITGTYDPLRKLSDIQLAEGYSFINGAEVPVYGKTDYPAKFNLDTENYNDYQLLIKVELSKAQLYTKFNDKHIFEFNYNGADNEIIVNLYYKDNSNVEKECLLPIEHFTKGPKFNAAGTYKTVLSVTDNNNFTFNPMTFYVKVKGVKIANTFYTIEDAIKASESGNIIIVTTNTSFADKALFDELYVTDDYHTIKTGTTLLVPFDATYNNAYDVVEPNGGAISCFVKLTVPENITINVNGALNVNGIRGAAGRCQGSTIKTFGQMQIETNSIININSGAVFNCTGYTTGEGTINVKNGGTAYDVLGMKDWAGGDFSSQIAKTSGLDTSKNKEKELFPINQYTMQNISARINVYSQAKLYGRYYVHTSLASPNGETLLAGSNALFKPIDANGKPSYISKYVDSEGKSNLELYGTMDSGSLSLTISNINIDSQKYEFPIPGNMVIHVAQDSIMNINGKFKFLPGSKVVVDKGATLNINSGAGIYAYKNNTYKPWTNPIGVVYSGKDMAQVYTFTKVYNYNKDQSVEFYINGNLNIEDNATFCSYIMTSEVGAQITVGSNSILESNLVEHVTLEQKKIIGLLPVKNVIRSAPMTFISQLQTDSGDEKLQHNRTYTSFNNNGTVMWQ